jgi:hypothetical protein
MRLGCRQDELRHQLVVLQRCPARSYEKLLERYRPLALGAGHFHLSPIAEQGWSRVGGWGGIAQIADNRGSIARLHRPYPRCRLGQGRVELLDQRRASDVIL